MDAIKERIALRTRFMNELYDTAQGSLDVPIHASQVADMLGLDFRGNDEHQREIVNVVNYLSERRLVKRIGTGAAGVMLTQRGVDEVEEARNHPNQPTSHLAAINLVYAETITHSAIQQGSPEATQSLTIINQSNLQKLKTFLHSLKQSIDQLELSNEQQAELEAEIQTLDAQVASPKPKKELIKLGLQSVRQILLGAASGVIASELRGVVEALIKGL
jgi:hypothetical protein